MKLSQVKRGIRPLNINVIWDDSTLVKQTSKTHPIGNITGRLIDRHYKVISRQLRIAGAPWPRALIARA